MSELEDLPEVSGLAKALKNALTETTLRIKQKQQVQHVYKSTTAFSIFMHHATVMGQA